MANHCHKGRWHEKVDIARALNVSQTVVRRFLKKHRETGSVEENKRSTLILGCKELLLERSDKLCIFLQPHAAAEGRKPDFVELRKAFSKFYRRHFELIEKYHVSLKKLMQQGICNPEFYIDLVYRFKKIIGNPNFLMFSLLLKELTVMFYSLIFSNV